MRFCTWSGVRQGTKLGARSFSDFANEFFRLSLLFLCGGLGLRFIPPLCFLSNVLITKVWFLCEYNCGITS